MFRVKFYCPRWGSEALSWDSFLSKAISSGYDGVEVYPLQTPLEKPEMLEALEKTGFEYSLLHSEMIEGADFEAYCKALERNLYELGTYKTKKIKPEFITSQTGREYYSKQQMKKCFAICDRVSEEIKIPIFQETHRNKWSYAAHIVKDYLKDEDFHALKLTLDISHWFCVSESYLEDQQEAIDLAIKHTKHIHARIGNRETPQVSDPSATENAEALKHHIQCWDKWINYLKSKGFDSCTITPEFGPYPYMSYEIGTKKPIADQWEINCWIKNLLALRYN